MTENERSSESDWTDWKDLTLDNLPLVGRTYHIRGKIEPGLYTYTPGRSDWPYAIIVGPLGRILEFVTADGERWKLLIGGEIAYEFRELVTADPHVDGDRSTTFDVREPGRLLFHPPTMPDEIESVTHWATVDSRPLCRPLWKGAFSRSFNPAEINCPICAERVYRSVTGRWPDSRPDARPIGEERTIDQSTIDRERELELHDRAAIAALGGLLARSNVEGRIKYAFQYADDFIARRRERIEQKRKMEMK